MQSDNLDPGTFQLSLDIRKSRDLASIYKIVFCYDDKRWYSGRDRVTVLFENLKYF